MSDQTPSERVVSTLSRLLGGTAWSRRSFLVRTSLVGSAFALEPRRFPIENRTAYQTVCGADAGCADGFSAFCCTINHGANFCPEGTFVGGWWKADRSAFCRGSARYYVDCNGIKGWPWRCHCPETVTCDHRHVACAQFRYGNCSLDIPYAAVGSPVVCRIVTCTPPWIWDDACTTTSFTDQRSESHTAPCLPGAWPSRIEMAWSDHGGPGGPLGPRVTQDENLAGRAGKWAEFRHGAIFEVSDRGVIVARDPEWAVVRGRFGAAGHVYALGDLTTLAEGLGTLQSFAVVMPGHKETVVVVGSPSLGTFVLDPPVLSKWNALSAQRGPLGYPTRSTAPTADGSGVFCHFAKLAHSRVSYRGGVYSNPVTGVHALWGDVYEKWIHEGADTGALGYPVSDLRQTGYPGATSCEFAVVRGGGVVSRNAIYSTRQFGTWAVMGPILAKWVRLRAERGPLGYPTADQLTDDVLEASFSTFAPIPGHASSFGGAIVTSNSGTWALLGVFAQVWRLDRSQSRLLGVPSGDEVQTIVGGIALRTQTFSTGAVYDSSLGSGCVLYGAILSMYEADGGPTGSLGMPTSSVVVLLTGEQQATFQFGTLTYTPS